MNVLLIKPPHKEVYKDFKSVATEYPPLGLAYIAAVLEKNGFTVKITDMPVEGVSENQLVSILKEFKPSIAGITATTPTIGYSLKLAALCKKELPDILIVIGGPHASAIPEQVLADRNVDFVIHGEGEYSFLELAEALKDGKEFNNILGISYKEDGKIKNNPARPFIENLDELPFPARHLLPMKKYFYVDAKAWPMTTIFTSRGCPGRCTYCSAHLIFGRGFRARSAKNVVDEIEQLVKEGFMEIHFLDDTFTLERDRVIEICDEIKKRSLKFLWCCPNGVRVNMVDMELLKRMKEAGCYSLAFGFESGNQQILNKIKKGITLEQSKNAIRLAKAAGMETWGFFMMGLPGDTEQTVRDTIDFAKELDPDIAKFHITIPLPGTELFELWKKEGVIKTEDWDKYGIHASEVSELPSISSEKLKEFNRQAYKEFYMRPKYFVRYIKRINSLTRLNNSLRGGIAIIKYALSGK